MPDVRRAPHVFGAGTSGLLPNRRSLLANHAKRAPSTGESFTHGGCLQAFSRRLPHSNSPPFSPVSRSRLCPVRFGAAIPSFSPSYLNRFALPEASLPSLLTAPAFGSGPPIPRLTRTLAPASSPEPPGLHGGSPAPPAGPPQSHIPVATPSVALPRRPLTQHAADSRRDAPLAADASVRSQLFGSLFGYRSGRPPTSPFLQFR